MWIRWADYFYKEQFTKYFYHHYFWLYSIQHGNFLLCYNSQGLSQHLEVILHCWPPIYRWKQSKEIDEREIAVQEQNIFILILKPWYSSPSFERPQKVTSKNGLSKEVYLIWWVIRNWSLWCNFLITHHIRQRETGNGWNGKLKRKAETESWNWQRKLKILHWYSNCC